MRLPTRFRTLAAALALPLAGCTTVAGVDDRPDDQGCVTRAISIGQAIPASLSRFDCLDEQFGTYVDWWEIAITQTTWVDIVMESTELDAYLELWDAEDYLIAEDDDSAGDGNAWIRVKLPPGFYYIAASSFAEGEVGRYIISVE